MPITEDYVRTLEERILFLETALQEETVINRILREDRIELERNYDKLQQKYSSRNDDYETKMYNLEQAGINWKKEFIERNSEGCESYGL